ncbi:DUF2007 domain-containing protein [Roseateles sp. BYS78W]
MKTLYEAASAIEAHMLVDLLAQEGIDAHIQGEALQGAMGEIPANGLVRLLVEEESFPAARAVIDHWESTQIEPTPRPGPSPRSSGVRGLLLGLVIGIGATYAAYRAPATTDGIDYDRDGVLDEKWTYSPNGMLLKVEMDRNLDHKVDYVAHYDARGQLESAESDDNFDGVFETRHWFKNGNLESSLSDTDGDGIPDLRSTYVHGVVDTVEYINATSGRPVRIEHYSLGVLQFADVDTDLDGALDTRVSYTKLAEVASREPLPK